MQDRKLACALEALEQLGGWAGGVVEYLRTRRVPVRYTTQKGSGARWFDWRTLRFGVFVNADYRSDRTEAAHVAALIAHEVMHLQQGIREAISVRGELVAWQRHYDVLDALSVVPADPRWRDVRRLDPRLRDDLVLAKELMRSLGGRGYHIEFLPLLPLGERLRYWARRVTRRLCLAWRQAWRENRQGSRKEDSG